MFVLSKQGNIPEADYAGFQANGIIELFAQGIIQGKHAGSGIESYAEAKSERPVVQIASEGFFLIPSPIKEGLKKGFFIEEKTQFGAKYGIGRSINRLIDKAA